MLLSDIYKNFHPIAWLKNEGNAILTGDNPVANGIEAAGNFISNSNPITAPTYNPGDNASIPAKVGGFLYNDIARPVVNSGLNFSANLGIDIGKSLAGQTPSPGQGKSPLTNLTGRLTNVFAGNPESPQNILGDAGKVASDVVNLYAPKGVLSSAYEPTLGTIASQGAKVGATLGGIGAFGQSLDANRNVTLPTQLGNSAVSGAIGAGIGSVLGAGIPVAMAGVGKVISKAGVLADKTSGLVDSTDKFFGVTPRVTPTGGVQALGDTALGKTVGDLTGKVNPPSVDTSLGETANALNPLEKGSIQNSNPTLKNIMTPNKPMGGINVSTGTEESLPPTMKNIMTPDKYTEDNNVSTRVNTTLPPALRNIMAPDKSTGGINVGTGVEETLPPTINKERGFITSGKESTLDDQVKEALKGSYDVKKNTQLMADVQERIKAQPIFQIHQQLVNTPVNKMTDSDIATGITLAHLYNTEGNYAASADLINKLAPELTAAGRKVQAASLLDKMTPEGVQYIASKELQKIGKTLDPEVAKSLSDQAVAIRGMADGKEKNLAIKNMMNEIQNLVPTSGWQKLIAVWKAGLLTSPKTTIRNLGGNTINAVAEIAKDPVATIADGLMSLATGRRTQTTTLSGTLTGAAEGLARAKDIMKYGIDTAANTSKFDLNHITWGNNPVEQGLKKYTDFVFKTMEAQDKPFYESAFKRSLYDQAGAQAINAGRQGDKAFIEGLVKNPTPEMITTAHNDAAQATFKDKTLATTIINKAKTAAKEANPAAGAVLDFIAPFTGVPTSVAAHMAAYSPYGLGKGLIRSAGVVFSPGKFGTLQRQAAQEIGRGVIGTAIMAIGAELMRRGLMTGDYPTDSKTQEQWKLDGRQPNSILINGKWRSINSIGPQASMLLVGGKMGEKDKLDANGNPVNKAAQTGASMLKTISDASFLQGVQGVLDAVNDPTQNASKWVNSSVSGIVPNIIRDVAKGNDTSQNGYMIQRESNNPWQAFANSVPGLREQQLPQRTVFGEPVTGGKGLPYNAFDIFNSRPAVQNDPVINELQRLNDVGNSATPSKLSDKQSAFGNKYVLTKEQLDQLEQTNGSQIRDQFAQMIASPSYQMASDEEKAKILNDLAESIRKNNANQTFIDNQQNNSLKITPPKGSTSSNGTTQAASTPIVSGGNSSKPMTTSDIINASTAKPPTKEQLDLEKYLVETGQKNSSIIGNIYVYKDPNTGNVATKSLDQLQKDAQNNKLNQDIQTAKNNDDYKTWVDLQNQKYNLILDKIKSADPIADQANIIAWQQQADAIQNAIETTKHYGNSFKRPTSVRKSISLKINPPKITSRSRMRVSRVPSPKIKSTRVAMARGIIKQPKR
jgi:hypothetical protein